MENYRPNGASQADLNKDLYAKIEKTNDNITYIHKTLATNAVDVALLKKDSATTLMLVKVLVKIMIPMLIGFVIIAFLIEPKLLLSAFNIAR